MKNLICKIKGHNLHLLDYIERGTEYQFCPRCGWKNYSIINGYLKKTEEPKEFKL
jgi:hypothetical protein